MKRWHKFVLVLSVFSVLFSSLAFTVFADSATVNPTSRFKPFFAPTSIIFHDGGSVVDISAFSSVSVDSESSDATVEGVYTLSDWQEEEWCSRYFSLSSPILTLGGVIEFSLYDTFDFNSGLFSPSWFELVFNDYYYSSYSSNIHLIDLFNVSYDFGSGVSVDSFEIYCDIVYLDSDHLSNDVFEHTSADWEDCFIELEDYLRLNYSDGALLTNVSLFVYPGGSLTEFVLEGTVRCVPTDRPLGSTAALDAWSDHYGDTIINDTPTILESVQIGLDAVWNTSLFGLFTIGQVFSACAGLALFNWLLKIFNR